MKFRSSVLPKPGPSGRRTGFGCRHPALCLLFLLSAVSSFTSAQTVSGRNEILYWQLSRQAVAADHQQEIPVKVGASAELTGLNVCGKFDPKLSVETMFDDLENAITTLKTVPQTIWQSLPGYVLCRARPGLCQLLQDYTARLESQFELHLRTCEGAVQAAMEGRNPLLDWITVAQVESWNDAAAAGGSTAQAYRDAAAGRNKGVTWTGGRQAGGKGQKQIQPLRHVAAAGWCLIQNKPPDCKSGDSSSIYSDYWKTPEDFKAWAAAVLGDLGLWVYEGAPRPESIPGFGLNPVLIQLRTVIADKLKKVIDKAKSRRSQEDLKTLSLPGLKMTNLLLDNVKHSDNREWLETNLADRIAMGQVVTMALAARRLIDVGIQEPNAQSIKPAKDVIESALRRLQKEIDFILYESEARNKLLGDFGVIIESLATVPEDRP